MKKNLLRGVLIAAVVGAAGLGFVNHAHLSGSNPSAWLASLSGTNATRQGTVSVNNANAVAGNSGGAGNASSAGITNTAGAGSLSQNTGQTAAGNATGSSQAGTTNTGTNGHGEGASASGTGASSGGSATNRNDVGSQTVKTTQGGVASSTSGQQTSPYQTSHQSAVTSPAKSASTGTKASGSGNPGTSGSTGTQAGTSGGTGTPATSTGGTPSTAGTTGVTKNASFTMIVSENHGQTVLSRKTLVIHQGENLMQYMQQNYTIQTAYGSGFIIAINGIHSQWTGVPVSERKPVDWFLYINQQQAPVGAASIIPRPGDVDDWDYHSWNPSTGQG